MLRRAWGWPARYGIAVVFTVFVAALKFAVPAFGVQGPDLFLTVPVAASAVFGGFGPALLATVGATIIAAYFTPPAGLVVPWDANGLDVVGFFFEGLIVAVLGAGARAALGRTLDTLHRSEELERERSALIETVNHELRNPLAPVPQKKTELRRPKNGSPSVHPNRATRHARYGDGKHIETQAARAGAASDHAPRSPRG